MNPFKQAKRRQKRLANEGGQMAVFIALIFQVLFVFFAMVVNIGLIVHDKINLQNSVDLAAYYAAAKQAEQLNEIAHINYQIRQDYKLLAWRLRVLGNFGRPGHPLVRAFSGGAVPDTPPTGQDRVTYADFPSVCITHGAWAETRALSRGNANVDNLCLQQPGTARIPELRAPPVIFPSPGNISISIQIADFNRQFGDRCRAAGPLNWQFTALANLGYRSAIAIRKRMIRQISQNLSRPVTTSNTSFLDRNGETVFAGLEKTIQKNLTKANKDQGANLQIEVTNGLNIGRCGELSQEQTPLWLREILIFPTITYTDYRQVGGDCGPETASLEQPISRAEIPNYDPGGTLQRLTMGEPLPATDYHSSRGYEKNPWCLAYVGVKAETSPRKPFAPFGSPIRLTARAFAMPFGGRIGPWDKTQWPASADLSTGNEAVDKASVPRFLPDTFIDRSLPQNVPNYSRYPGDVDGLRSQLAMSATLPSLYAPVRDPARGQTYTLSHYSHLGNLTLNGDVLPWDTAGNQTSPLRPIETAAVAPDLFDITYYSIEPNYYPYYFRNIVATRFPGTSPIADAGNRRQDAPNLVRFSVKDQIETVYTGGNDSGAVVQPNLYWMIRRPEHLLTSWSPKFPNDFTFPTNDFGRCRGKPNGTDEPPTVGDCIAGGRTGYSVQIVSKDYLLSQQHKLGGTGVPNGEIRNKPADTF